MDKVLSTIIATTIAEIFTFPLNTLKTNYQNISSCDSWLQMMMSKYHHGGLRTFYQGIIPALSSQLLSTTSKYTLYRYFNSKNNYNKFFNGMISGLTTSIFTHPFDNLKIHWQMKEKISPKIRNQGIYLLYRGYSKTLAKTGTGAALYLPLYDNIKEITKDVQIAALLSAIISTIIIQPLDYLKTRHIYGLSLYEQNPQRYYKGLILNLARIVPHFVITLSIIDILETTL